MSTELKMPALSPTMEKGNLARWLKSVGDQIKAGDLIAEIETDKATMEYEAPEDGILVRILIPDGSEDVAVGTVLAMMVAPGDTVEAAQEVATSPGQPENAGALVRGDETGENLALGPTLESFIVQATPLARRLASAQGLSLAQVAGSGPHGRIVKRDIQTRQGPDSLSTGASLLARIARQAHSDVTQARTLVERTLQPSRPSGPLPVTAPAVQRAGPTEAPFEDLKLTTMRKVIAARLTEAKQTIPHFYMTVEAELDALLALRREINAASDVKISVNDFIIKALARALIMVPEANVQYSDDNTLRRFRQADISVAVAIPGGLITPVIRAADRKPLSVIATEMKSLAEKARAGKLSPEDYQGGTFSLSNLGMYGIKQFDAVINPPQAGILAIGEGEKRPVAKDGELAIATVLSATLSVDHRAIDGAGAARLLAAIRHLLETPLSMLV